MASLGVLLWLWESDPRAFSQPEHRPDFYWWVNPLIILCLVSILVCFAGLLVFGATRKHWVTH